MAKAYQFIITRSNKWVHTYTTQNEDFAKKMFKAAQKEFKQKDSEIESITELCEIEIPDAEV